MSTIDPGGETLALAVDLMRRASVTPADAGCQDLLRERLKAAGFRCRDLSREGVCNLWATVGDQGPLLAFTGHTDVVPPGPIGAWTSPPFEPRIRSGRLYGRGAADMKTGLAAMVVGLTRWLRAAPALCGRIGLLITSDEEGPGTAGVKAALAQLLAEGEEFDWCIVGEPSCREQLGDQARNGRRGSLSGILRIHGVQGHVAYAHLADNPIHRAMPALLELTTRIWDRGNQYFPPTSLQISDLHAGVGAANVIPGDLEVHFNLRFNTEHSAVELQARIAEIFRRHGLDSELSWQLSGEPFLTLPGRLTTVVRDTVAAVTGLTPHFNAGGGTSDGRHFAAEGVEVVEFGMVNDSVHRPDEYCVVADLEPLSQVYEGIAHGMVGS